MIEGVGRLAPFWRGDTLVLQVPLRSALSGLFEATRRPLLLEPERMHVPPLGVPIRREGVSRIDRLPGWPSPNLNWHQTLAIRTAFGTTRVHVHGPYREGFLLHQLLLDWLAAGSLWSPFWHEHRAKRFWTELDGHFTFQPDLAALTLECRLPQGGVVPLVVDDRCVVQGDVRLAWTAMNPVVFDEETLHLSTPDASIRVQHRRERSLYLLGWALEDYRRSSAETDGSVPVSLLQMLDGVAKPSPPRHDASLEEPP